MSVWRPLRRRDTPPLAPGALASIAAAATRAGLPMTEAELQEHYGAWSLGSEHWINDVYHVVRRTIPETQDMPAVVHLSIKRHDRGPAVDWRDKQRIKDELVGPDCEAVELYPADSRVVDCANQYHIWAIAEPGWRFPFGFEQGLRMDADPEDASGAVQRPMA